MPRTIDGPGDSPQYALDRLDPDRIRMARELRGMTGRKLAHLIEKSPSAVSQFESGTIKPDVSTLVRISMALKVPTTYFAEPEFDTHRATIPFDKCHFRARRSVSQRDRRSSQRNGETLLELVTLLEYEGVSFPDEHISSFWEKCPPVDENEDIETIDKIASRLRQHWGMGYGPIPNFTRLLESRGIFVIPLLEAHHDVDAYSAWAGDRPCIMPAYNKGGSRARFDLAHELGHLVLHEDVDPGSNEVERQANRFAGAFLAPRESFLAECPRSWDLPTFWRLKKRWRMAAAALTYRAYDLGCISQSTFSRAFKELTVKGYRKDELHDWEPEQPTLLTQGLQLLAQRLDTEQLASRLGLYDHELNKLLERNVDNEVLVMLQPSERKEAPVVKLRS